MSIISEQKSQLAKLMATENLTVEHQKISTAKFDPKNRVLYLPIWQDMSGTMYDLLCGHEVGHALYTPADGWHDAVVDQTKGKNYKGFLNVVEDARIEKKIKRRFPGLRLAFQNAYVELMARDFFGVKFKDINQLPFIDRLNIFTKSQYTMTSIRFNAREEIFVRRIQDLESWSDVLKLTDEIYAYSKEEQSQMEELLVDFDMTEESESTDDADGFEQEIEQTMADGDEDGDESEDADKDGKQDDRKKAKGNSETESQESSEEENDSKDKGDEYNRDKESSESFGDQYNPVCKTDEAYRKKEILLIDVKARNYKYVNIPTPILENIITPAKRVHELYSKEFEMMVQKNYITQKQINQWVNEFKTKNERYVGLLAKEFEMRKAAKSFSKSKVSDTGDIDINKLAGYKFDDNIFRKVMVVPKGKKHGLILLLDKSGSMSDNMAGSIEQILVLAMFCRKVNIPFAVYGYGDEVEVFLLDRKVISDRSTSTYEYDGDRKYVSFTQEVGEIVMGNVRMREYLNSKMSNAEFTKALRNMILVKRSYEGGRYNRSVPRPESESLSNTPTTQAIVASAEIMKQFKKENNLDITNLVIVQDGDADSISSYFTEVQRERFVDGKVVEQTLKIAENFTQTTYSVPVIRDKKIKYEKMMADEKKYIEMNKVILDWFKKTTGSKIFGFYLTNAKAKSAIYANYRTKEGQTLYAKRRENYTETELIVKELMKKFRSEKYLSLNSEGYSDFYLVSGGDELTIEEDQMDNIDGKVTAAKLKSAFMKFNKKKAINRVLVSKFIQGIAVA